MKTFASLFSAALAIASIGIAPAVAQDNGDRTIDQYACKDIVRESGSLREVAIAFLHGYVLGKSGNAQFNLNTLMKQTDTFLDQCIENPNKKAIEVMVGVKK
jgi:HdeA/HdeB family protein